MRFEPGCELLLISTVGVSPRLGRSGKLDGRLHEPVLISCAQVGANQGRG